MLRIKKWVGLIMTVRVRQTVFVLPTRKLKKMLNQFRWNISLMGESSPSQVEFEDEQNLSSGKLKTKEWSNCGAQKVFLIHLENYNAIWWVALGWQVRRSGAPNAVEISLDILRRYNKWQKRIRVLALERVKPSLMINRISLLLRKTSRSSGNVGDQFAVVEVFFLRMLQKL